MSIKLDCANSLTNNCVQEPPVPENELAIVSVSATRECTSGGLSYRDKFQGGGERIVFYPSISLMHL